MARTTIFIIEKVV